MPRLGLFLSLFTLTFATIACTPARSSFFGEPEWVGVGFSGNEVVLDTLPYSRLVINVYSPDCVPCWKEIPALNYIESEWFKGRSDIKFYIAVDPYQILTEISETASWEEVYPKAKVRMLEEVKNRSIGAEMLFLKKPFQVSQSSLVTGTPETLLFETRPLRLYYNFIGSITEETDPKLLATDRKLQFLKHQIGLDRL